MCGFNEAATIQDFILDALRPRQASGDCHASPVICYIFCPAINFLITLMHAINYFNQALMR